MNWVLIVVYVTYKTSLGFSTPFYTLTACEAAGAALQQELNQNLTISNRRNLSIKCVRV